MSENYDDVNTTIAEYGGDVKETIYGLLKRLEESEVSYEDLRIYCEKLATALPEGMLPKDIENIRNANVKFAQQVFELEAEIISWQDMAKTYRKVAEDGVVVAKRLEVDYAKLLSDKSVSEAKWANSYDKLVAAHYALKRSVKENEDLHARIERQQALMADMETFILQVFGGDKYMLMLRNKHLMFKKIQDNDILL